MSKNNFCYSLNCKMKSFKNPFLSYGNNPKRTNCRQIELRNIDWRLTRKKVERNECGKKFASISFSMDELFIYQHPKYKTVLYLLKRKKFIKPKKSRHQRKCGKISQILFYFNGKKPES